MQLVNLSRVALNHRGISNMQFSCKLQTQIRTTRYRCSNEARQDEARRGVLRLPLRRRRQNAATKINRCSTVADRHTHTRTHTASHTHTHTLMVHTLEGVWNYVRYRKWHALQSEARQLECVGRAAANLWQKTCNRSCDSRDPKIAAPPLALSSTAFPLPL